MNTEVKEDRRLRALRELKLLDTPPSESFDRITRMACQLFGAPVSAVSLTDEDRQWFKSRVGCGTEIARSEAPCAEVTRMSDLLVIPDLAQDPQFGDGELVRNGMRFYAGAPLVTREGFTLGAICVLDSKPRELEPAEIKVLSDLAEMVMAQVELQHAYGRIDPASGLPNRLQFADDVDDMSRDHPGEARVAVLIDLVGPSRLAQTARVLGPSYLDQLIRVSAASITARLEAETNLYQVGATQFVAVLAGVDPEDVRALVVEHLEALTAGARGKGIAAMAGVVVGIAPFRLGEHTPADALRAAHAAAQDARDANLALGMYSPAADAAHKRRYEVIAALRQALAASDQLSLVYQPRIDMRSGRCRGAEALLRWTHPALGPVSPGEFIPLAEAAGLARQITEKVLEGAVAQAAEWRAAGVALRISVNVSAANLEEDDFGSRVAAALLRHGLPAEALEVEFTESALIRKQDCVLKNLAEIRAMGVACAIDDFGTGYSSFSYLQDIPAEIIKIDQSFIRDLAPDSRAAALVRNMVIMARELGYRVVAEGVETNEAYDVLKATYCDEAQGYLISRPLPPAAFAEWLSRSGADARPLPPAPWDGLRNAS